MSPPSQFLKLASPFALATGTMGLFLMLSGVANSNIAEVESALLEFATQHRGKLEAVENSIELAEDKQLILAQSDQGHVTVFYPDGFIGWDEASAFLSEKLGQPVLSLHIHDGDFWMYLLFQSGEVVDRFNPLPDYWEEVSDETKALWTGNADLISTLWPNLPKERIESYLIHWDEEDIEGEGRKAYPDDEYTTGQDWQLVDFMTAVGLKYPLADNGTPTGPKYQFTTKTRNFKDFT